MSEFRPRPISESLRQTTAAFSDRQLKGALIKETARVLVFDARRSVREGWTFSLNYARMLLGQPRYPSPDEQEEQEYLRDDEARERLRAALLETTRRRLIRQEMMRKR